MSLVFILIEGLVNDGTGPWLTEVYIVKEYAALIKLISIKNTILELDEDKIDVNNKISLNKLIDGGAPMFHAANKNHHIDIVGHIISNPFVRYILRVCDIS